LVLTATQNKTKIEMASILSFRKIHAGGDELWIERNGGDF